MELMRQMRRSEAVREQMAQWKIGRTQAQEDMKAAELLLAAELVEKLPAYRAVSINRLERLLDKAEDIGDLRAAALLQREITRISGIAAPQEIKHSGAIDTRPSEQSYADLEQPELDLLAKIGAIPAPASTTEH
jgi:hypothetical protein